MPARNHVCACRKQNYERGAVNQDTDGMGRAQPCRHSTDWDSGLWCWQQFRRPVAHLGMLKHASCLSRYNKVCFSIHLRRLGSAKYAVTALLLFDSSSNQHLAVGPRQFKLQGDLLHGRAAIAVISTCTGHTGHTCTHRHSHKPSACSWSNGLEH